MNVRIAMLVASVACVSMTACMTADDDKSAAPAAAPAATAGAAAPAATPAANATTVQAAPAPAAAAPADPDAWLKQLQESKPPAGDVSRKDDEAYVKAYTQQVKDWAKQRGESAKAFIEKHPDHPGKADALFIRVLSLGRTDLVGEEYAAAAKTFLEAAPTDPRGAAVLFALTSDEKDAAKRTATLQQIVERFPDSPYAEKAKGRLRQSEDVGKPFVLAFNDAISGRRVETPELKGKVLVIDFWATWCPECLAAMPHLKDLYAKYKDQGVEFIGVSLDEPRADGGLDAVKQYVRKNEIRWPQYFQGNAWESEFSRGWGVFALPAVFVVDADGNLHSTTATAESLDKMIPELLKKAGKQAFAE